MAEVFIPKSNKPKQGLNLALLFNKKEVKGEVGIEIEVEGSKLPHEDSTPSPWAYHVDGSLRGHDNGEYVLAKPLKFSEIPNALDKLWEVFKEKKSKLDDSNRTSVHVHLNCQLWYLNRLAAFLGMYYTLEECLTEWCGEHRVGNLFCLRGIDAPGTVTTLRRFIQADGEYPISEQLHYAGLNPNALKKFGSLEVRTLRGCSDPKVIEQWVGILERLYKLSADFEDPREVCTMISGMGTLAWFEAILGDKASVVRNGINFTDHDIDASLKTGIRLAQDLCYCRDWSMYKPFEMKPDPFNRSAKYLLKKMGGGTAESSNGLVSGAYNVAVSTDNMVPPSTPQEFYAGEEYDEEDEEPDYDDLEIDVEF